MRLNFKLILKYKIKWERTIMWVGEKHMASLKVKKKKKCFSTHIFPPLRFNPLSFWYLNYGPKVYFFFNHWVLERIEKLARKRQGKEKSIGWLHFSNKQSWSWC